MAKKTITLSVNPEVYDKYKKLCRDEGLIISRQFEFYMEEKIKKNEKVIL